MTTARSVTKSEVPLYLLPRAIAHEINKMGDDVYRISVKRTHWHHYNISVRVKALPKELAPAVTVVPAPAVPAYEENGEDDGIAGVGA